jgi:hypothetical protein
MKDKKYLSSLLSIAFIGIFSACQSQANSVILNQENNSIKEGKRMKEKQELPLMKFTPDDYKKIYDGGGDCTEEFPIETLLLIEKKTISVWIPKLIQYRIKDRKDIKRRDLRLPIVIRVDGKVNSFDIKVTMINLKTKELYSAIPHYEDPNPIAIDPMKGSYEVEKEPTFPRGVGGFFNYNLLNYLDVPLESATYEVIAELDDMKSKTVRVQIVIE